MQLKNMQALLVQTQSTCLVERERRLQEAICDLWTQILTKRVLDVGKFCENAIVFATVLAHIYSDTLNKTH